ncbi:MAG: efflux RND transporter periplasmic adaptor subunit [Halanaerobiales bacterium]
MKKIIIVIFVIILIFIGIYYFIQGSGSSSAEELTENTVSVQEEQIIEEINIVEAFGNVVITEQINIVLDFPAKIDDVIVKAGDRVTNGERLITLDICDIELELKKLERQQHLAENELQNISENNKIIQEQIVQKLNTEKNLYQRENRELERKKHNLNNESSPDFISLLNEQEIARRKLTERREELADKVILSNAGAITQYDFDQFKKTVIDQEDAVKMIELALDELRFNKQEEIDLLEKTVSERASRIDGYELELAGQRANSKQSVFIQESKIGDIREEIEDLEKNLYHRDYLDGRDIISTLDTAVISNINCISGDYHQEGEILVSLLNLNELLVEADVPEEFIKDVKEGAAVRIIPLALPGREYHGRVVKISDMAEKRGGETVIPVEISIDDNDDFLLPNFNVDVEIEKG